MIREIFPEDKFDNFSLRLNKLQPPYPQKQELNYVRNKIQHNINCFLISKIRNKKEVYSLKDIITILDEAYIKIASRTIFKELANLIIQICKKFQYSMVYDSEAQKPIKKIVKWTESLQVLYGANAINENNHIKVDKRTVMNNLLKKNILLLKI